MCGRFTLSEDVKEIEKRFDVDHTVVDNYEPSFNIAPSQHILAIVNDGKHNRLGTLKWGLIPVWAKDEKIGYKLINARGETIHQKNSFKQAFRKRRCIIPTDGFYEWKKYDGKKKQPYRIYLKNEKVFGFAGLWEKWTNDQGEDVFTCTIITTKANEFMRDIHDRMPVILSKANEKVWLDPAVQNTEELTSLLTPLDSSLMTAYQVSSDVNNPKNNYAGLLNSL
ncbi:SOS response-associated peptidase [Alteribacillus sp. JSM 102045]|uniref:SOS response-associated peptidase n=1 Tax=Alteribacillus sp. JSM 102045 TaxID=1562101 RepID=UPI0035C0B571